MITSMKYSNEKEEYILNFNLVTYKTVDGVQPSKIASDSSSARPTSTQNPET